MPNEILPEANNIQRTQKSRWYHYLLDLLAMAVWTYVIINIFFFDLDAFLIRVLPFYLSWIIEYKLFVLIGVVAIAWLFTKSSKLIGWFFYTLFWPLIALALLAWKISIFLWNKGSWTLIFALANVVVSFFKSIKQNFILFSSMLIFMILISVNSNKIILWLSVFALSIILSLIFIRRFVIIFRPSALYQIYSKMVSAMLENGKKSYTVEQEIKERGLENIEPEKLQKWGNNLQALIIFNRGAYFLSSKLAEYQRSKLNALFYVINFLILIIIAVFTFSFINLGLYKINAGYFSLTTPPSSFIFFYYSANILLNHGASDVVAIATVSRLFSLFELMFTFLLGGILLALLLSVKDSKETAEINAVIENIEKRGDQMEGFIQEEYQMNIKEAIAKLFTLKIELGSMKLIEYLSKYISES